jgi:hypothetical protein
MDVCVCVYSVLGSGLAMGSPVDCVKDQESEKEAKAQQRALEPYINR